MAGVASARGPPSEDGARARLSDPVAPVAVAASWTRLAKTRTTSKKVEATSQAGLAQPAAHAATRSAPRRSPAAGATPNPELLRAGAPPRSLFAVRRAPRRLGATWSLAAPPRAPGFLHPTLLR